MAQNIFKAGEQFTVARAADTQTTLLAALDAGVNAIDLSAVTEFDTAGVQLLLAVNAHGQASGTAVAFLRPSAVVMDLFQRYGLHAWLSGQVASGVAHVG